MARSKKLAITLEEYIAAAKKWREEMYKSIHRSVEKLFDEECKEIHKRIRELPSNITQKQIDILSDANKKAPAILNEEFESWKDKTNEQIKKDMRIVCLDYLYHAYLTVLLFDSGSSIEKIADELGRSVIFVTIDLKTYNRL